MPDFKRYNPDQVFAYLSHYIYHFLGGLACLHYLC